MCFGWEYRRSNAIFSVHSIRRHLLMIRPSTSDVTFDHLVTVCSARYLYHKVILVYAL